MNIFNYRWASTHKILYFCYSTLMLALVLTVSMVFVNSLFEWSIVIPTTVKEWFKLIISGVSWGFAMSFFFYISMKNNYKRGKQQ